jgi:hypothetical protein
MRKDLENGKDTIIDLEAEDPRAKRLDYIFFSPCHTGSTLPFASNN